MLAGLSVCFCRVLSCIIKQRSGAQSGARLEQLVMRPPRPTTINQLITIRAKACTAAAAADDDAAAFSDATVNFFI